MNNEFEWSYSAASLLTLHSGLSGEAGPLDARLPATAVWEPNLCLVGDGLVCFYVDEGYKDQKMLQTLVHRVTRDLTTRSQAEFDFEVVGPPLVPVHFTSSNDGVRWGKSSNLGSPLISDSGTRLSGSPNISWRLSNDGQIEFLVTGRISIDPDGTVSNNALFSANAGHHR